MAMTLAERQRRYKERALKDPDGLLLTRLEVLIDASAAGRLQRMATITGQTKRDLVQRAIQRLADEIGGIP